MKYAPQRLKDAVQRLGMDADFQHLLTHLVESRSEKLKELEDANVALQSHKLQGYCQALRDLIELCQGKP